MHKPGEFKRIYMHSPTLRLWQKKKKTKKTQAASKSVQIEFENGRSPTYFAYVGFSDRNWLLFLFRLQLLMAVSLEFSQNGKMVMVKKKKKW